MIVFAAHGEQCSALLEQGDVFLKGFEGFAARRRVAQLDALQPVVRHHAAPERVVQIQHQHLFRSPTQAADQVRNFPRQIREQRGRTGLLALEPRAFVAGLEAALAVREKFHVAEVEVGRRIEAQLQIHPFAEAPVGTQRPRTVGAGVVPRGEHEVGDDHLGV